MLPFKVPENIRKPPGDALRGYRKGTFILIALNNLSPNIN